MNTVGNTSNRIHRQGNTRPMSETRWIVPAKPYTPPKGSMESIENTVLTVAAVVVIIFGFAVLIASEMM